MFRKVLGNSQHLLQQFLPDRPERAVYIHNTTDINKQQSTVVYKDIYQTLSSTAAFVRLFFLRTNDDDDGDDEQKELRILNDSLKSI